MTSLIGVKLGAKSVSAGLCPIAANDGHDAGFESANGATP